MDNSAIVEDIPLSRQQQGQRFLDELPDVDLTDLQNEEEVAICDICMEVFDNGTNADAEAPVKLPCDHVLGRKCMARWLETKNSCPICRRVLFHHQPPRENPSSAFSPFASAYQRAVVSDVPETQLDALFVMVDLFALRRSMALELSVLDRLERSNVRLNSEMRRELREMETRTEAVEARLREICVRFPDLMNNMRVLGSITVH